MIHFIHYCVFIIHRHYEKKNYVGAANYFFSIKDGAAHLVAHYLI